MIATNFIRATQSQGEFIMNGYWKRVQGGLAVVCGAIIMASSGAAFAQAKRNCNEARTDDLKAQCMAREKAEVKCGKLEGDARRICQRDEIPRDCAKSENKARCEAEMAAHKACRGDAKTYRACYESKTKKG
jgi:hypothetical protein